jgi:hypothetical protein
MVPARLTDIEKKELQENIFFYFDYILLEEVEGM